MERDLSKEVETISALCNKYQEVIVKAYLKIRRNRLRKEKAAERAILAAKLAREREEEEEPLSESKEGAESKEVDDMLNSEKDGEDEEELTDWVLERWSFELANRRQYLAFLKSLQEEVRVWGGISFSNPKHTQRGGNRDIYT